MAEAITSTSGGSRPDHMRPPQHICELSPVQEQPQTNQRVSYYINHSCLLEALLEGGGVDSREKNWKEQNEHKGIHLLLPSHCESKCESQKMKNCLNIKL